MSSTSAFPGRGSLRSEKALRQEGTEADSWQLASITTTRVRLEGKCTGHAWAEAVVFYNFKHFIPEHRRESPLKKVKA